jgi:hypothetical protein
VHLLAFDPQFEKVYRRPLMPHDPTGTGRPLGVILAAR